MTPEQRRQHRIGVALRVHIRGRDRNETPFEETVHSSDLSRGGCSFDCAHDLGEGSELEIEIYRNVAGSAPFLTRGVVVRAAAAESGQWAIGLQFTGPQFPAYRSESTTPE